MNVLDQKQNKLDYINVKCINFKFIKPGVEFSSDEKT